MHRKHIWCARGAHGSGACCTLCAQVTHWKLFMKHIYPDPSTTARATPSAARSTQGHGRKTRRVLTCRHASDNKRACAHGCSCVRGCPKGFASLARRGRAGAGDRRAVPCPRVTSQRSSPEILDFWMGSDPGAPTNRPGASRPFCLQHFPSSRVASRDRGRPRYFHSRTATKAE